MKKTNNDMVSKNLFGDKIVSVKSFTKPDKIYQVNLDKKTCTCDYFVKKKGTVDCKHVRKVFKIENNVSGFSLSLLKSATQKAVRRGDVRRAVKCAKLHIHKSPNDFWRRLPILIVEEACLNIHFRQVVDLAVKSAKKDYVLTASDEAFGLRIVEQIASSEIRDCVFLKYKDSGKPAPIIKDDLPLKEMGLVNALLKRSRLGGMRGDCELLRIEAGVWYERFKNKTMTRDDVRNFYPEIKRDYKGISLTENANDILPEALDFHCLPLLPILKKKQKAIAAVKSQYPEIGNDKVESILRQVIWRFRSAENRKRDITSGKIYDWKTEYNKKFTEEDAKKYNYIYDEILPDVISIGRWYLGKITKI
jgi:hypothetical protein